jgi:hypothetical protein
MSIDARQWAPIVRDYHRIKNLQGEENREPRRGKIPTHVGTARTCVAVE